MAIWGAENVPPPHHLCHNNAFSILSDEAGMNLDGPPSLAEGWEWPAAQAAAYPLAPASLPQVPPPGRVSSPPLRPLRDEAARREEAALRAAASQAFVAHRQAISDLQAQSGAYRQLAIDTRRMGRLAEAAQHERLAREAQEAARRRREAACRDAFRRNNQGSTLKMEGIDLHDQTGASWAECCRPHVAASWAACC